jgi:hypothetical protein
MNAGYPLMPKDQARVVKSAIRKVFVEVWDPIRVMDDLTWPRDEYDGYIGRTFELLVTGGSDQEVVEHLVWAEARMGMDGSQQSHADVITALRAIDLRG